MSLDSRPSTPRMLHLSILEIIASGRLTSFRQFHALSLRVTRPPGPPVIAGPRPLSSRFSTGVTARPRRYGPGRASRPSRRRARSQRRALRPAFGPQCRSIPVFPLIPFYTHCITFASEKFSQFMFFGKADIGPEALAQRFIRDLRWSIIASCLRPNGRAMQPIRHALTSCRCGSASSGPGLAPRNPPKGSGSSSRGEGTRSGWASRRK